jgi:hypothetical protein
VTHLRLLAVCLLFSVALLNPALRGDDTNPAASTPPAATAPKDLVDLTTADSDKKFTSDSQSGAQVSHTHSDSPPGVTVSVAPGDAGYPGLSLKPDSGTWDLSGYSAVAVTITNTSAGKLTVGVRVDDSGGWQDNDSEMGYLDPGQTQTVKVNFGFSFNKPGFAVNKASISQVLIMTDKTTAAKTFRIESVKAIPATP